jgi:hypothetical protein
MINYKNRIKEINSSLKSLIIKELDNLNDNDLWDMADEYVKDSESLDKLVEDSENLKDEVIDELTKFIKENLSDIDVLSIPSDISKSVEYIEISNPKYYLVHFRNSNSTDTIEYVNIVELINILEYLTKKY